MVCRKARARTPPAHLNCAKEKSDAMTAALPSRPLMPHPMCAACAAEKQR